MANENRIQIFFNSDKELSDKQQTAIQEHIKNVLNQSESIGTNKQLTGQAFTIKINGSQEKAGKFFKEGQDLPQEKKENLFTKIFK